LRAKGFEGVGMEQELLVPVKYRSFIKTIGRKGR